MGLLGTCSGSWLKILKCRCSQNMVKSLRIQNICFTKNCECITKLLEFIKLIVSPDIEWKNITLYIIGIKTSFLRHELAFPLSKVIICKVLLWIMNVGIFKFSYMNWIFILLKSGFSIRLNNYLAWILLIYFWLQRLFANLLWSAQFFISLVDICFLFNTGLIKRSVNQ